MSDTILSGDFTVYYKSENNQKRIVYTGAGTTYTVRQLYSALQDLFDELNQMDDQVPMTAQTPTEFTLVNGWFIDDVSTQYLYGGAITTNGWASNEVFKVAYSETVAMVSGDIGKTITTSSYSGTVLDYNDTGATNYLWIRPDDPATDLFDSAEAFTITSGTGTGNITVSTNVTGEQLWANIYTIGSLASNTTMYVIQDGSKVTDAKASTDWWGYGHIDILVKVKDMGTEIDDGVVKVFNRRPGSLYDNFEVDLTNGGRNPIPLATAPDLNEARGLRQMVLTTASGNFTVGEIIQDDSDATIQGVVAASSGTAPNVTVDYYLIGDPLNDFSAGTGGFTGQTSSETATAVAPSDVYGATFTDVTITHAATTGNLNNGSGTRPYSISVNCAGRPLSEVYEYFKYITRRGSATAIDGTDGEQYIGSQNQVEYSSQAGGDWTEGNTIYLFESDNTLAAQGVIVADHDDGTTGDVILRQVRFFTSGAVTKAGDNVVFGSSTVTATVDSVRTINPTKQSPLGTFAGGTMFAAPGVWLTNYAADQSFQLIDDDGTVQIPPNTVSVSVTNTRAGDRIGVYRTNPDGTLKKDEYTCTVTAQGATSITMSASISNEAPPDGTVIVVDTDQQYEYPLRYASYSAAVLTLDTLSATADAGGSATSLVDADGDFVNAGVLVGDLVFNDTENTYGFVTNVTATTLTLTNDGSNAPVTDWSSDAYIVNGVPEALTGSDTAYIPFLFVYETQGTDGSPGNEFDTIIHSTDIDVVVRARQAGVILPFEAANSIKSSGMSQAVIRNPDTIYQ